MKGSAFGGFFYKTMAIILVGTAIIMGAFLGLGLVLNFFIGPVHISF